MPRTTRAPHFGSAWLACIAILTTGCAPAEFKRLDIAPNPAELRMNSATANRHTDGRIPCVLAWSGLKDQRTRTTSLGTAGGYHVHTQDIGGWVQDAFLALPNVRRQAEKTDATLSAELLTAAFRSGPVGSLSRGYTMAVRTTVTDAAGVVMWSTAAEMVIPLHRATDDLQQAFLAELPDYCAG